MVRGLNLSILRQVRPSRPLVVFFRQEIRVLCTLEI